ncbi:MAG: hypothetical protein VYC39_10315 [Myxococcota bacterium]|nr:hypothetical protein [Myxococcota bacterium]
MKRTRIYFLAAASCLFLVYGCPSTSTLKSARTLDKGKLRFAVAPEYSVFSLGGEPLQNPQIELAARYGLTDNIEIGAKLWLPGLQADVKYALLRSEDMNSGWDLSINPGFGYIGGISGTATGEGSDLHILTFYLPFLAGYNLGGGNQIVLGPKLINQTWLTSEDNSETINLLYLGSSLGFVWKYSDGVRFIPEVSFGVPVLRTLTGVGTDASASGILFQAGVAVEFGE